MAGLYRYYPPHFYAQNVMKDSVYELHTLYGAATAAANSVKAPLSRAVQHFKNNYPALFNRDIPKDGPYLSFFIGGVEPNRTVGLIEVGIHPGKSEELTIAIRQLGTSQKHDYEVSTLGETVGIRKVYTEAQVNDLFQKGFPGRLPVVIKELIETEIRLNREKVGGPVSVLVINSNRTSWFSPGPCRPESSEDYLRSVPQSVEF